MHVKGTLGGGGMIFDHIARSEDCGMVRGKIRRAVAHCTVFLLRCDCDLPERLVV